jgi:hypothetical protein
MKFSMKDTVESVVLLPPLIVRGWGGPVPEQILRCFIFRKVKCRVSCLI